MLSCIPGREEQERMNTKKSINYNTFCHTTRSSRCSIVCYSLSFDTYLDYQNANAKC